MNKSVLVTGATGLQGGAVVDALLKEGFTVKALVPSGEDKNSPVSKGVAVASGSFDDVESIKKAFAGVHHVALSFPLIFDREMLLQYAKNVIAAFQASNIESIVLNTNLPVQKEKTGIVAYDVKLEIEQLFDTAKLPYISLRPTIYMDNLVAAWSKPLIVNDSILPYPIAAGKAIGWLTHADLAKFTVAAINNSKLTGRKFNLSGLQLLTGEDMATVIGNKLGKYIQFIAVTPDDFEKQLSLNFPAGVAKEIANVYRFVEKNHVQFRGDDLRESTLVSLPVSLQTAQDWADSVKWQ